MSSSRKALDIPSEVRVVMIGDFPRNIDTIGGGVESVMVYLCEHIGSVDGVTLDVVTLDRWGLGLRRVEYLNYTAHYVPQAAVRGPLKRILNIERLTRQVERLHPDIVHAQIAGQYSEAAHRSGRPYVLTLHGIRYLEADLKTGLIDKLYRRHVVRREERKGIRQAPNIISINPFIEECFPHDLSGRIARIANPIADVWFDIDQSGDPFGLLYAGRITPRKDLLSLLRGFRRFHVRFPQATLRIAGAPDSPDPTGYLESLERYIAEADLRDAVTFLGNLSEADLIDEYRKNAVFVIAAVLETAPMSIAQAQAAGRLVVATDAGGCRHMIRNGESGMIVPIGDAEKLGNALIKCAENPEWSDRMRQKSREHALQRYRAADIAERTLRFYREILSGR